MKGWRPDAIALGLVILFFICIGIWAFRRSADNAKLLPDANFQFVRNELVDVGGTVVTITIVRDKVNNQLYIITPSATGTYGGIAMTPLINRYRN